MNYFLIYHVGHGGGNWLINTILNHPGHKMWVLGEINKPCQLDFDRRGIEDTVENKTEETLKYFEDAERTGCEAAGVIKCFTPAIRHYVQDHGGRLIQMLRNPLSKCGGSQSMRRLERPVRAGRYYEAEYGRQPKTHEEMVEAHFIYARRKFYDHFMRDKRAALFPLVRLEDINQSMGHDSTFFIGLMEWLTQVSWPQTWIDNLRRYRRPNEQYRNWIAWTEKGRIADVCTEPLKGPAYMNRTSCFPIDPESMIVWNQWDSMHQEIYKKWFADVEKRLGYNQDYPSSVSQDWEWAGRYEWGET
jgi:hypothetical protein